MQTLKKYKQLPVLLTLICVLISPLFAHAQNTNTNATIKYTPTTDDTNPQSPYFKSMKAAIDIMDKAISTDQLKSVAQQFVQISQSTQFKAWLPDYYAAYCLATASLKATDPETKDYLLKQAQSLIDRAKKVSPQNAEIAVVQAYIYQLNVEVNPTERATQYGTLLQLAMEDARNLDPNNPRLYYLQALTLFLSPEYAGGGLQKAYPVIKQAAQKYTAAKPATAIAPKWGEAMTNYMQSVCEKLLGK